MDKWIPLWGQKFDRKSAHFVNTHAFVHDAMSDWYDWTTVLQKTQMQMHQLYQFVQNLNTFVMGKLEKYM